MPHLPRMPAFPIAGERSILTAAGAALKIPAKEKDSPLIGQFAPEIFARDHLGRTVSLHATIALGRPIVLYFFPLAGSPHCTKESCSFRDAVGTSPIFNDLNAVVIGVSQDPPTRSKRFVDEHHLGFRILHDENRQIMDAWGVGRGLLGLIDGRCTFIIDHEGVVRAMLDGVWDYQGHRNFAEKWLCRIEHELSGRQRFYVEHEGDESSAVDEIEGNVKVVYGDAVPGRGIAMAPRHGAAPEANKKKDSKPSQQSKLESLSVAAEANANSMSRAKSKRNLRIWLRPTESSAGVYDEPLYVDFKSANRNLDDVQQRTKAIESSSRAASSKSAEKVATRMRSLRLDNLTENPALTVRDFAASEQLHPRSRQDSSSGSAGWATPSTVSARSISTSDTSHTSPGEKDSQGHAASLTAALKNGLATAELERSDSSRRRNALESATSNGLPASKSVVTSARSSSLLKKASNEKVSAFAAAASPDARTTSVSPEEDGTIYANGNIARMPLLPASAIGGERSVDSMATILDRRTGNRIHDISTDSNFSISSKSSLPVPPRPSTRNLNGSAIAAAASARLLKSAAPSPTVASKVDSTTQSMVARSDTSTSHSETSDEDGCATDRGNNAGTNNSCSSGLDARRKVSDGQDANHRIAPPLTKKSPKRRVLPPQPPLPSYAPPVSPSTSPSASYITWAPQQAPTLLRSLRTASSLASPSTCFHATHSNSISGTEEARLMERRLSNTPSLAPSVVSVCEGSVVNGSEYGDYSPSLAGSTHTFGGLED
ncbi:related to peroxiredoxin q [Melanopsichium pennsylvanicum]|uniref:thioredoxin-dependent peroxiredoxin n=2 Tax=Melanopsichium pennsylvanicum TaxID=63383 RepID=A0AAJ4XNC6_9BASI|nr:related to peroxiredoxin q [Melanopsichium pennsylvanicum 4]SNX85026.1 related to peroxiredoxin q [Melanopsichium pennsylvanicum]